MGKYKFKINQLVYILIDPTVRNDYEQCIIRKRTIIDKICYYQMSKVKYWQSNSTEHTTETIFEEEIFNIGFRNYPRTDNWLQEVMITDKPITNDDIPICSKNGCELVNDLLEEDNSSISLDEEIKKEIEQLKGLINIKEIEIQIVRSIFKESIDRLEHEQNKYLYQKACLEEDEYEMKKYLLDAIE